jgi:predicted N-acyltransferase
MEIRVVDSPTKIDPGQWDRLADSQPFMRHAFFAALHESGSAVAENGWQPCFLTLWEGDELVAATPLYRKQHSFGEFVFDWSWAEAYARQGRSYYPKLVAQVPFTPVEGSRLLARDGVARQALLDAMIGYAQTSGVSSLHVLFPNTEEAELLSARGLLLRRGVQFHWRNAGWSNFEEFLTSLTREKRKKIRQERRRVADAGVVLRRLVGQDIGIDDWHFYYACYSNTYLIRGRPPYLTLDFFMRLGMSMPENLLLVIAERAGKPIAASLCLHDSERLYGRYWGAVEDVPCLHFEACYYQPMEFCLERELAVFEGGAQGEHKLARGFMPVQTHSAHWLADRPFHDAVARFLERESEGVAEYCDELEEHSPYRAGS